MKMSRASRAPESSAAGSLVLLPDRRTVRRTDLLATLGGALVAALGAVAGLELARLGPLGTGLADAASALQNAGHALETQSGVPIVGSRVADLAGGVVATAGDVHAGAVQATAAVHVLAVVIGLAVAFVSVPVLAAYLWFRLSRSRALRGLRRLLAGPGDVDPALVALLAHRAVLCLPYDRLRSISVDPWGDLIGGRHRVLAAADLERLGLAPPTEWSAQDGPSVGSTRHVRQ